MNQVEGLQTFLTDTSKELSRRLKELNDTMVDIEEDDCRVKKMLEAAFMCWEDIATGMERFKTDLNRKNILKESLIVPQRAFLNVDDSRKRDSGIDTASSMSSGSPYVSSNRLSAVDTDADSGGEVTFNLQSTRSSFCDFNDGKTVEGPEPNPDEMSTVYIHILPTDQKTDTTALREKIRNLSRSTMRSDNIELHLVPSDAFIGIPSRQSSLSTEGSNSTRPSRQFSTSSEGLNILRARLPSSNDSLLSAMITMSTKIPEEHSDSSDDQRLVSSSDSEVSLIHNRLPLNSTHTQTDTENRMDHNSVETQTD